MTGRERILTSLNHREPDKLAFDFGSTPITGIHVKIVEQIRDYYGLEKRPVKVVEPFQMLGEIDEDLLDILDIDAIGVSGPRDMFGHVQQDFIETKMPWGQIVLLPSCFHTKEENGRLYVFPSGDTSCNPTAMMPQSGFFFDAIERNSFQIGESWNIDDNLEEYTDISDEDLNYWKNALTAARNTGRAVVANIGGTGLGDVALVPGMALKNPKGIRSVADWYMATVAYYDQVGELFDKQTDIAIRNLSRINDVAGDCIDVIYVCGADFGTQRSQFCSAETLKALYGPYYKKVNDWIHQHTNWKTFKHCCGSIVPLIDPFIEVGFDIINPVQINAEGMDPQYLKDTFGERISFWGGGIDTQKVLPFGKTSEVEEQVKSLCDIFGRNGGFVFNAIHNIQANAPISNVIALLDTIKELRK